MEELKYKKLRNLTGSHMQKLLNDGHNVRGIASILNVSHVTLYKWLDKNDLVIEKSLVVRKKVKGEL